MQSSDEEKDDEISKEFMLMAIENLQVEAIYDNEEGEVDLEGELVSTLKEI